MSYHSLAVNIGWGAVFLGLGGTLAQFSRARRLGVGGISLATWVLSVFLGCFWITYGAIAHSREVVMGSLLILPFQLSIVYQLQPWKSAGVVVRSFAFFVVCCALPTVAWGWVGGVYGTGVAMTLNRGPQIIELIRQEDASGVSVASWMLGAIGCAFWVAYYLNVRLWAALVSTTFAGLANLAIALLATWRHRQVRKNVIGQQVFAV